MKYKAFSNFSLTAGNYSSDDCYSLRATLVNDCSVTQILREKCPNTESFLVRIFPHSDCIRRDTKYLSVFSPNTGKYGPVKTLYLDTFHAVRIT